MPVDLPTREDYFDVGAVEVQARSLRRSQETRISPAAVTTPGTDINIIIAACSAMADEATRHLALRLAALYLDSAEGEDLDRLVSDRWSPDLVRKQAAAAVAVATFTRPIPAAPATAPAGTLDVGTVLRTGDGTEFQLTQPAPFAESTAGQTSQTVTVIAQAVSTGPGGNVDAGAIVEIQGSFDPTIVVTNAEPAAGGAAIESDDSLRERARAFFRTARRATLSAIELGALSVPGVASATATELLDESGDPNGYVVLQIADANGQANEELIRLVREGLLEFRAAGIVVTVLGSTPSFQTIQYLIPFAPGTDTLAAAEQLRSLTVATVNTLGPGEPLLRSLLYSLARSIPGAIVGDGAISTPVASVTPASGEVIRTSAERVIINGI